MASITAPHCFGWLQDLQPTLKEKKRSTMNQKGTGTCIENGEDSKGPHGPGEFDQDKPEEELEKVMASKSSGGQV